MFLASAQQFFSHIRIICSAALNARIEELAADSSQLQSERAKVVDLSARLDIQQKEISSLNSKLLEERTERSKLEGELPVDRNQVQIDRGNG